MESAAGPATWLTNRSESDCSPPVLGQPALPRRALPLGLRFAASACDGPLIAALEACSAGSRKCPSALWPVSSSTTASRVLVIDAIRPGGRPSLDSLCWRTGHPGDARDGRNVFCMACPFLLPRTLAACAGCPRAGTGSAGCGASGLQWACSPCFSGLTRRLPSGTAPWWTAWLILAYFASAVVIDGFFRGMSSFCKYVCPIGQFNFVQSLVSPSVVDDSPGESVYGLSSQRMRIRGGGGVGGCELGLFLPRKARQYGLHLLCLDCIHACPHDNIGHSSCRIAREELWHDSFRSGVGRFGNRPDLAALVVVLVLGAFVNAAGMVAPVLEWRDQVAVLFGQRSPLLVTSLLYAFGLFLLPVLLMGSAAMFCRWFERAPGSRRSRWPPAFRMRLCLLGFQHVAGLLQFFTSWRASTR